MKFAALLLFCTTAGALRGQETRVVCMQEMPVARVIGGQASELALQITSAKAGRMKLRGTLYQIAGRIAAPVARDLPVAGELAFDGTAIQPRAFILTPPEVRVPALMELRFAAQAEGAADWQPAGVIRLVVYPKDLLARIASTVAHANRRFIVLGESPQLKRALRLAGAAFEEAAEPPTPSGPALFLAQGGAEMAIPAVPPAANLLLFMPAEPGMPPGVYRFVPASGAGATTKVTLPIFTDFEKSPDRQLLLATLLQQALAVP